MDKSIASPFFDSRCINLAYWQINEVAILLGLHNSTRIWPGKIGRFYQQVNQV